MMLQCKLSVCVNKHIFEENINRLKKFMISMYWLYAALNHYLLYEIWRGKSMPGHDRLVHVSFSPLAFHYNHMLATLEVVDKRIVHERWLKEGWDFYDIESEWQNINIQHSIWVKQCSLIILRDVNGFFLKTELLFKVIN